jgi:hypothetical protein
MNMAEIIDTEPRLFTGNKEDFAGDSEALARISRLVSLQQSIARRPGVYLAAIMELEEDATAETLSLHDDAVDTRAATSDPKKRIKEFFEKRDDKELMFDDDSEEAIYGSEDFRKLAQAAREKTATSVKSGKDRIHKDHPEAREASNAVRRHILKTFIGRVVLFDSQKNTKKVKQAG